MKRTFVFVATLALAVALALLVAQPAASPVQASHKTVVAISGEVALDGILTVQVGAHASGPANDLSGQGFDNPGKPPLGVPPGYCRFPLNGSLVGDVVTLDGVVTFSNDPANIGVPVAIIADASTGDITFFFDGVVLTGTGSVVIAHQ